MPSSRYEKQIFLSGALAVVQPLTEFFLEAERGVQKEGQRRDPQMEALLASFQDLLQDARRHAEEEAERLYPEFAPLEEARPPRPISAEGGHYPGTET